MKKLVSFGIFIIILIGIFLFFSNRVKDYEQSYDKDEFNVIEKYNKKDKYYYFHLTNKKESYDFVVDKKYSKDRKIIDKINIKDNDDYKCVSIKIDDYDSPYICVKDGNLYDPYYARILTNDNSLIDKEYNGIHVYSKGNYYIWNGYGITDIIKNKKFNFLKKESYDNNLSYQYNNYLIVADYDASREFNKFYIYNHETKQIDEFKFEYKIDFSSYFMGDVDGFIYLFDKKNKVQYKINIEKKKIEILNDFEACDYYDNKWDTGPINTCVYNNVLFNKNEFINYSLIDKKLYYNYYNIKDKILFDDKVSNIIYKNNNIVYFMKEDTVYKYSPYIGSNKVMSYFEWNFSYYNKIFIFD